MAVKEWTVKVPELIFIAPPSPYLLCLDGSHCLGKWGSIGRPADLCITSENDSLRGECEVPFVRWNNGRSLRRTINAIMLFARYAYACATATQAKPSLLQRGIRQHANSKLLHPQEANRVVSEPASSPPWSKRGLWTLCVGSYLPGVSEREVCWRSDWKFLVSKNKLNWLGGELKQISSNDQSCLSYSAILCDWPNHCEQKKAS